MDNLTLAEIALPPNHFVYLATPYTSEHKDVELYRFNTVNKVASELMRKGVHLFSPISHTRPIAEADGLPHNFAFWKDYDTKILGFCTHLFVLTLPGWRTSVGVTAEIAIAKERGLPVYYLTYHPVFLTKT